MEDPRIPQLARQLVRYSTATKRGESVLLDLFDVPEEVGIALIREVRVVGLSPRLAAAPLEPKTVPLDWARALSMFLFSRSRICESVSMIEDSSSA